MQSILFPFIHGHFLKIKQQDNFIKDWFAIVSYNINEPIRINQCLSQWGLVPKSIRLENLIPMLACDTIRMVVESLSGLFHRKRVMYTGLEKWQKWLKLWQDTDFDWIFCKVFFFSHLPRPFSKETTTVHKVSSLSLEKCSKRTSSWEKKLLRTKQSSQT